MRVSFPICTFFPIHVISSLARGISYHYAPVCFSHATAFRSTILPVASRLFLKVIFFPFLPCSSRQFPFNFRGLPSSEISFDPESWTLHYAIFDFPVQKGRSFAFFLSPTSTMSSITAHFGSLHLIFVFFSSYLRKHTDVPPVLQYARISTAEHQ
jgi:hypothetical protein